MMKNMSEILPEEILHKLDSVYYSDAFGNMTTYAHANDDFYQKYESSCKKFWEECGETFEDDDDDNDDRFNAGWCEFVDDSTFEDMDDFRYYLKGIIDGNNNCNVVEDKAREILNEVLAMVDAVIAKQEED